LLERKFIYSRRVKKIYDLKIKKRNGHTIYYIIIVRMMGCKE